VTYPSDDPVPHLTPPEREHTGYGQGIIRAWDPATFQSTVEYRGALLHDLPVLDRIGATTYQPGDVVLLMRWSPTGRGLASYWIAGAPVDPADGRDEEAIAFLTSTLARNLSAEVFAERIHEASVATSEGTGSATYTDLATPGPTVPGVEIVTGKALVLISGRIRSEQSGSGNSESFMSFAVSGASTLAADDSRAASTWIRLSVHPTESHIVDVAMRGTAQVWLTGLNNGQHTFTAKYRTTGAASNFGVRAMTVISF
jgi:hypothetical protein